MGDLSQAEAYIRRNTALVQEARGSPHPNWRQSYAIYGRSWEADADEGKALIFEARGQLKEAEAAYVRAEAFRRASVADLPKFQYPVPAEQILSAAARKRAGLARVKAQQNRLSEAEADMRRALLEMLKKRASTIRQPSALSGVWQLVLVEQGRYAEAEQLIRSALDIQRTLGIGDDTHSSAQILSQLGSILGLQAQVEGSRSCLCRARQSHSQMGAAASSGARAARRSNSIPCMPPARSRPGWPRHRRCSRAKSSASAKSISRLRRRAARSPSAICVPVATPTPCGSFAPPFRS